LPIPERFLALGDSFTIGTGTTPDRSFPARLVSALRDRGFDIELSNPAVNGFTTDDLIRDELPQLSSVRPTLITVLIGANDIVQGSNADRYRAQLARIHQRVRRDAPTARVVALPQPDWSRSPAAAGFGEPAVIARTIERFNEIAREEALATGATWVDLWPLMREQARRGMVAPDGLHPSPEAYAEWARVLADRISPTGSSQAS
jgi:lysophospholipase L1-like esterase